LKEDLDRIIDEIDEVLEENAEEFVKNYVQRGRRRWKSPSQGMGQVFMISSTLSRLSSAPLSCTRRVLLRLLSAPHGTTILALKCLDGVIIAADRQATEGYQVASRHIEKSTRPTNTLRLRSPEPPAHASKWSSYFRSSLSIMKIGRGSARPRGKANKLAQMVRQNLPAAFQGLVVIPIFAGYDLRRARADFKYDITGGRYEEGDYYSTGSGGKDARNTLKKFFRPGMTREQAVRLALEALLDASEEDVATGGPDPVRGIYPSVKIVAQTGTNDLPEDEIRQSCEALLTSEEGETMAIPFYVAPDQMVQDKADILGRVCRGNRLSPWVCRGDHPRGGKSKRLAQ
jgi:proteasome beta subunit